MIVCEVRAPSIESREMSESSEATLDDRRVHRLPLPVAQARAESAAGAPIDIAVHDDLHAIEPEWRRFQESADCTVFQAFDWLAAWQAHVGRHERAIPAIVVGRRPNGQMLFLIPLAVRPGLVRRLTFLGSDLCDYNAPLLASDFSDHVKPDQFHDLWKRICERLALAPQYRHDLIDLTKMPETIGAQRNPFLGLDVGLHPSGAHCMQLHGTWDAFYLAKRSSVTRRRDRTKRKRLGELGEVRMVTPQDRQGLARTMNVLIEQKAVSFARMGVANMFARPGHREFFLELATNPRFCDLVHVSRLDVGATWAAINLGLQFRGCYYHVLASYDEGEVSRFGPGAAHLRDLISHAIGLGFQRFDFTVGDERYKLEWSDTALKLYDHVAATTPRGWLLAKHAIARRRLKRAIKQNPRLFGLFARARSAVGALSFRRGGR
jgi:CelD/BcsL family acetyltransferase involved in cellulose biosynthesis